MNRKLPDTDALILEILYFNAGLRSLTFYAGSKNPRSRPDWLPKVESIGLDNDLILKDSDVVIDFACHEASEIRPSPDRFCWLGVYRRSVDTVGDRGNFLGAGVWVTPGFAVRHQLLIDSLIVLLGELEQKRESLIAGEQSLLENLAKFRREIEICKIESQIYQKITIAGQGEVDRAYVKIHDPDNGTASVASTIGALLLGKAVQVAPRTIFLLGPELPSFPRRGWRLFKNSREYTGHFSETDFLFEQTLVGHVEIINENEALKTKATSLSSAIQELEARLNHSEVQRAQISADHRRLSDKLQSLELEKNALELEIFTRRHERQAFSDRHEPFEEIKTLPSPNTDLQKVESMIQEARIDLCNRFASIESGLKKKSNPEGAKNNTTSANEEIGSRLAERFEDSLQEYSERLLKALYISAATLGLLTIATLVVSYLNYSQSSNSNIQPSSTPSILKENHQTPSPSLRTQEDTIPPSDANPR